MNGYCVYIITNKYNKVLYTGVTNDISRRIYEHKSGLKKGFSKKYNLDKLVYIELTNDAFSALNREKQIKGWIRKKKNELINTFNPDWKDLMYEYSLMER